MTIKAGSVILRVSTKEQLSDFKQLALAYLQWLSEDLDYQGIDDELSSLPGAYSEEYGGMLLLGRVTVPESDGVVTTTYSTTTTNCNDATNSNDVTNCNDATNSNDATNCNSNSNNNSNNNSNSSNNNNTNCNTNNNTNCNTNNQQQYQSIGTVAIRALKGKQSESITEIHGYTIDEICELKRLFVSPEYHGKGLGTLLVLEAVHQARLLGYKAMVLDTLERLTGANTLYKKLGFEACCPYNECPLEGILYLFKDLST